ncbi:hypothetical protein [Streptomyces sp. P17]|uniref:hypothetical protein n=1 Tax=Streptomyces sp. P17 TaxID=3074716 RepID=UPI0028F429F9|nr:hypothetical protein [Streptomyces sp. P17]MDT9698116.1 hypothetical protein [Streptomyces sp. P17]
MKGAGPRTGPRTLPVLAADVVLLTASPASAAVTWDGDAAGGTGAFATTPPLPRRTWDSLTNPSGARTAPRSKVGTTYADVAP